MAPGADYLVPDVLPGRVKLIASKITKSAHSRTLPGESGQAAWVDTDRRPDSDEHEEHDR
jgi:hypothetical protein